MWERKQPGAYYKGGYGPVKYNVIGIIEQSKTGWWWWLVIDRNSGEVRGANRCLLLKHAKEEADKVIQKFCLRVV